MARRPLEIEYKIMLDRSVRKSTDIRITGLQIKEIFLEVLKSDVVQKCGYILIGMHFFLKYVKKYGNNSRDVHTNMKQINPVDIAIKLKVNLLLISISSIFCKHIFFKFRNLSYIQLLLRHPQLSRRPQVPLPLVGASTMGRGNLGWKMKEERREKKERKEEGEIKSIVDEIKQN